MRKEDVMPGDKVCLTEERFEPLKKLTPKLENRFTVKAQQEDGFILTATIGKLSADLRNPVPCSDFEPLEELFTVGIDPYDQSKWGTVSGEKLESGLVKISTKEEPITQEYIESFGFATHINPGEQTGYSVFKREDISGVTQFLSCFDNFKRFTLRSDMKPNEDTVTFEEFQNYTCTTREQLRFLLTNGRIDCTK